MAHMYPSRPQTDPGHPETRVFQILERGLPNEYVVLHQVKWLTKRARDRARDGEADFLIAHPRRGALILEIKGGQIAYDGREQAWYRVIGDSLSPVTDPFEQGKRAVYNLMGYLKARPGWPARWGPFGYAVGFPDGAFKGDPLPHQNLQVVIDGPKWRQEDQVQAAIDGIQEFWGGRDDRADERGLRILIEALAHDLEIRPVLSMQIADAEREIIRLSERQLDVLTYLAGNRRVAVGGPAGSGKTLLAAEKARRLVKEGFRVLLTCFNRPLAEYLEESLPEPKPHVATFHQLCGKLAREAGLNFRGDVFDPHFWDQLPGLLADAAGILGPRYDAIVADEGQDFDPAWWVALQLLLEDPDHGVLYVFYDNNQAIFGRPSSLPEGMVDVRLTEVWRNSKPIFDQVALLYEGDGELTSRGPDGPPVEFVHVEEKRMRREVGRLLHRFMNEEGIPLNDVVVLTPRSIANSRVAGEVGNFNLTETPGGGLDVELSSTYRFKGLDAPVIVLCDEEANTDGAEWRRLAYVAYSRARILLVVLSPRRSLDEALQDS